MQEISNYTFTYEAFPEAMGMLWKRMLIDSKQVGPAWLKAVVRFRIHRFGFESWIRQYGVRIRILLSSSKNSKKNLDSYCFVTSLPGMV